MPDVDTEETTESQKSPEEMSQDEREKFMATARKRYSEAASDEKPIREQAALDLRFVAGDQWDNAVKNDRITKGRPALTFNRCHTFVQQVSNEARQNKPQIKFVASDSGDPDTADVMEGMARHIQYSSDAQVAYETAVEYSAGGGFGYFGFITDWADEEGWDQELKVRAFLDPAAVYGILIPSCFGMEPQFAFVVEDVPVEDYKRQYDTDDIEQVGWERAGSLSQGWIGTDTVRVAEYWYITHETKEITRKNPATGEKETRKVSKPRVKFCKINGLSIIPGTETDWPGKVIPIVPVLGKQIILESKPMLFSVVRFQRDPQQLINFYKTRIAETLGTAPIQPWIVVEGQLQGHEKEWAQQNTVQRPWLTVRPTDVNGNPAPPPTRQVFEPPIQSLSEASAQEVDDMKATSGIYDASLGAQSNESSGIALQRRQQQSNNTNMHFMDNLERAFKKGGLIVADVMPKIYDTQRMVRILGQDEQPKIVKINGPHQDGEKKYHYKVGGDEAGKYDVIVTMGRAFSTKRMESFDMMTSVLQTSPNLLPMIGDIFFRNSDLAGADQLAERFKKMLPPNLQDQDDADPATKAQALQAQLAQAQQHLQAINAYAQQLEKEKEGKIVEMQSKAQIAQIEQQTKLSLAKLEIEAKIAIAEITTKAQSAQVRAKLETDTYQQIHSDAHDAQMQANDQQHEAQMAQVQHANAMEQGDQAAQNQAALAQQQAANQPQNGAAQQ